MDLAMIEITPYTVNNIIIVSLLGCSKKVVKEIYDRFGAFGEAGIKYAILGYDDGFYMQGFNLSVEEIELVKNNIITAYNLALGVKDEV